MRPDDKGSRQAETAPPVPIRGSGNFGPGQPRVPAPKDTVLPDSAIFTAMLKMPDGGVYRIDYEIPSANLLLVDNPFSALLYTAAKCARERPVNPT